MADIDPNLIGSVINALPLDRMIGGPLQAMVNAQVQASRAYAQFLMDVCFQKTGDKDSGTYLSRNIQFEYDDTLVDDQGELMGTYRKTMRIPLVAAITHPNICIEEGSVDFELEVTFELDTKGRKFPVSTFGGDFDGDGRKDFLRSQDGKLKIHYAPEDGVPKEKADAEFETELPDNGLTVRTCRVNTDEKSDVVMVFTPSVGSDEEGRVQILITN